MSPATARRITFICGCKTAEIISRDNLATMDAVAVDEDGFLICAIHRVRRYGYRSLPIIPIGDNTCPDWSVAHYSDLEIESLVVFGELPHRKQLVIHDIPDKRIKDGIATAA